MKPVVRERETADCEASHYRTTHAAKGCMMNDAGSESCLPDSRIECLIPGPPSPPPRFALFDFDGTLSLIREGWPEVMVPLFVETLLETGTDETQEELEQLVACFVAELTGKQTIYQMMRLSEEVRKRGGRPLDPVACKAVYNERLMNRIAGRRRQLECGDADPELYRVPGSVSMLDELKRRGVSLYLASGTDESYVREEVRLLRLDHYFGEHVYGAQTDYRSFSKQQVIDRLLRTHGIEGSALVGFGDGYVEIENVRSVGGLAVAVASNESARDGTIDEWKRDRLLGVGAQLVIPDFSEAEKLCSWIWGD